MTPCIICREAVAAVHEANALTGEVPCWDAARGVLWWVDVQGQRLLGLAPGSGRQQIHNLPSMPGLLVLRQGGGLVVGLEDGLYGFDPERGLGERIVAVEADDPRTRINDGAVDPAGRVWFGTMDKSVPPQGIGSLYCYAADGGLRRIRDGVRVSNATAFSPDGRTLYFADTPTRTVEAHDYDPASGTVSRRRPFSEYPPGEMPDGACVDAEGAVWIAVIGGSRVERRMPDRRVATIIELPVSRPTMPRLGGPDGRTLFITSQRRFLTAAELAQQPLAGDLLAVHVEVPAAPSQFAAV